MSSVAKEGHAVHPSHGSAGVWQGSGRRSPRPRAVKPPSTGRPTKGEADTPFLGSAMRHSQHAPGAPPGRYGRYAVRPRLRARGEPQRESSQYTTRWSAEPKAKEPRLPTGAVTDHLKTYPTPGCLRPADERHEPAWDLADHSVSRSPQWQIRSLSDSGVVHSQTDAGWSSLGSSHWEHMVLS